MDDKVSYQWASAPGQTVNTLRKQRGLTVGQLVDMLGLSLDQVLAFLSGAFVMKPNLARSLAATFGSTERFWLARDAQYRDSLERITSSLDAEEAAEWLRTLPIKDMQAWRWIAQGLKGTALVVECLKYFGVATIAEWRELQQNVLASADFRMSDAVEAEPAAVAAWMRQGELVTGECTLAPWNPEAFRALFPAIRTLTNERDPKVFLPQLKSMCARVGVAVAVVRPPKKCSVNGATKFLSSGRALLLLSFRYLRDDAFWFTFFHEAGHLLLHGAGQVFLEGKGRIKDQKELEANAFAAEILIPQAHRTEFLQLPMQDRPVIRFARSIGIAPGIVAGQLQYARNNFRVLNKLKRRYVWEEKPTRSKRPA